MMVPVPLSKLLKLSMLVEEVRGLIQGLDGDQEGILHPPDFVVDPDTGREIPGDAVESPEPHPVDPEDDPEVEFEEVGLGTPT